VSSFEEKTAGFIRSHGLFAGAEGIVLAVSGGADSIALLYAMHALVSDNVIEAKLICAHVNHQLRGVQSDGDQAFVIEHATKLDIPVVVEAVDVKGYAATQRLSMETAGRKLRLACVAKVARSHGCRWIATGHQKNDNAETIIQRLSRGTGFRGLAGIRPQRPWDGELRLASPLLDCTREEVAAYLQARNVTWREDRSNADCAHRRNFIRHRLLPTLQNQSSEFLIETLSSLATSAERLCRQNMRHAEEAATQSVTSTDEEALIDAAALVKLPRIVAVELIRQQLVKLNCGERNLARRHYESILRLAQSEHPRGKRTIPGGLLVVRDGDKIVLQKPPDLSDRGRLNRAVELSIPGVTHFDRYRIEARTVDASELDGAKIKGDKSPFVEYLALDRVTPPVRVRYRRRGDRFQPLGMSAETKVGKFLTAAKVPLRQRGNVLVFQDRQHILWLCPVRLGQRAKVAPTTRRLLELTVNEETTRDDR